MKFLKSEFDAFQNVIKKNGLNPAEFHQLKKKGHLYVEQEGRKDLFSFFRKKETILNDQLKWEDKVVYYLDPKKKTQVDSWDEVLIAFENWLKSGN